MIGLDAQARRDIVIVRFGALLAVVGVGVVLTACGRESDAPSSRSSLAAQADPEQALPVLARERRESDALPTRKDMPSRSQLSGGELENPVTEANFAESRRALTTDDGDTVYVIPYNDAACAVIVTGSGNAEQALVSSCVTSADLADRNPAPAEVYAGCSGGGPGKPPVCERRLVFGLAPSGVKGATAELTDGRSIGAQLASNAYIIKVPPTSSVAAVNFTTLDE